MKYSNGQFVLYRGNLAEDLSVQVNDSARPRDRDVWVLLFTIAPVFLPSMYKGSSSWHALRRLLHLNLSIRHSPASFLASGPMHQ
jgi:hypothetical protein